MFFAIFCITILLVIRFWYQQNYGEKNKILANFSSPPSLPIVGHLLNFLFKTSNENLKKNFEFIKTQPKVFRIDLSPFTSIIYVHDVKIIQAIFTNPKLIDKASNYEETVSDWLGTGLLVSSGQKWHQRRKIITPTFHFKILDQFVEVMEKHGEILVEKLRNFEGREIDIFPLISLYALDVICETAMGYQLNAQTDGESDYVNAVKQATLNLYHMYYNPLLKHKFLPSSKKFHRMHKEVVARLHKFTNSVISERKKFFKQNDNFVDEFGTKRKLAFLDLLLQAEVDGKPLDDEGIREEVDTFMFEGHDTTTSGIAFALLNIAKHPKIQKELYEECKNISNSTKDHKDLNFLEKVIKESLRLFPPVPTILREFKSNETIEGVTFPAKTPLRFSPLFMGRDADLFPDPLKFDPSRFDNNEKVKLFSYMPFSLGSRNCVGQKFAMQKMKIILSKIILNFEIFVRKENENPPLAPEITLKSVNGINLCFIGREKL